ncbi:MAG: 2-oxo-tetronate isomerase [Burkholderiales bacterium]
MPRFAANLSFLYTERDFLDRFAAASKDGFRAVEFLFPYEHPATEVASRLKDNGLKQVLFNMPPGDWGKGERGTAALPGREQEFRDAIAKALEFAAVLDCSQVHVMAGLAAPGADRAAMRRTYVENLRYAAGEAAKQGVNVLIEPINTGDIPGFFLNRQDEAHAILADVGAPNLKVQMDLYHCQIVEGDVTTKIRRYIGNVGHFQIAGVPGRHEPNVGEMNYPYLFSVIDELGFEGWIGCEYRPKVNTTTGLGWINAYR